MKKCIAILISVVLTAGLLTGCQPSFESFEPVYPEGVTKEKLESISADYDVPLGWYHIDGYGSYYLGCENGYDIFYFLSFPPSPDMGGTVDLVKLFTVEIGNVSFYPCTLGNLRVYKDDNFSKLSDCYNEGMISQNAVLIAKERFDEYMQILKSMDHDVYWQREKKSKLKPYKGQQLSPLLEEMFSGSISQEYLFFQKLFQAVLEE